MVFVGVIRYKLKLNVVFVFLFNKDLLIVKLTGFSLNCIALFQKVSIAFFAVMTSLSRDIFVTKFLFLFNNGLEREKIRLEVISGDP